MIVHALLFSIGEQTLYGLSLILTLCWLPPTSFRKSVRFWPGSVCPALGNVKFWLPVGIRVKLSVFVGYNISHWPITWRSLFFSPLSRVHQHTCAVLQHILHVLSHWAGHMAGLLLAALLQGKEADRVKRPEAPYLGGSCLPVSQHIPTSTLLGLASAKQQQVGLRGSNSSFHSCKREYQGCPLKNYSPAYLVVWNMKGAVGRNALWDMGGICHCISEICASLWYFTFLSALFWMLQLTI